jgi:hypothetical protein
MRAILVSILGGCLLCLVSGCGESSRVEMPKNPVPPPKNVKIMVGGGGMSVPKANNPKDSPTAPTKKAP